MRLVLIAILFVVFAVGLAFWWARRSMVHEGTSEQAVITLRPFLEHEKSETSEFKVVCWNMAYAFGMASEGGAEYRQITPERYESQMKGIVDLLRSEDADVIFLQEIDFGGKRSLFQDQAMFLAKELGYPYLAYAVSWDVNYIPFPKGPEDHFGRTRSGGAILSKFKITGNEVTLYPKPVANPFWYNWFYLFRYSQIVTLNINGRPYKVVNNHLEAFDKTNRKLQSDRLSEIVKNNENILVVAGDFNTTPSLANQKSNFPLYPTDNYDEDGVYDVLVGLQGLEDSLPQEKYLADEKKWFTFPSVGPERKLDYIFKSEQLEVVDFRILFSPVSDHFPIAATLRFR